MIMRMQMQLWLNLVDSNCAMVEEPPDQGSETIVEVPDEDSPSDGYEITVVWDRRKENILPLAIQPQPDDILLTVFDFVHRCPECCRPKDVNAMVLCNNCRSFQCRDCFVKGCCVNQSAESCSGPGQDLPCINDDKNTMAAVEIETSNYAITSTESVKAISGGKEWSLDIEYLRPHENAI